MSFPFNNSLNHQKDNKYFLIVLKVKEGVISLVIPIFYRPLSNLAFKNKVVKSVVYNSNIVRLLCPIYQSDTRALSEDVMRI